MPQLDQKKLSFIVENSHSGRRLFTQSFQLGNKPEKGVGAQKHERGESVTSETRWALEPVRVEGKPTTYIIRNPGFGRALFARVPKQGEKWHVGVGAAALGDPKLRGKRAVPPSMQWQIVPQWGMSKEFPKNEDLVDVLGAEDKGDEDKGVEDKDDDTPTKTGRGRAGFLKPLAARVKTGVDARVRPQPKARKSRDTVAEGPTDSSGKKRPQSRTRRSKDNV